MTKEFDKAYKTADEHRAYIDGLYAATEVILDQAAQLWSLGRDSFDLDCLRDELVRIRLLCANHVCEAQRIENESKGKQ